MTIKAKSPADRSRAVRLAVTLIGLAVSLGACKTFDAPIVAAEPYPDDYRLRHPIAVTEADRSIVVFVGTGRGGMTAAQRADVMGMAQTWLREGTGGITIDMPVGTPNARAAHETLREIRAIVAAAGVPPRGVSVRQYQPKDSRHMAAIRLNYPRISATAGPCGLWPDDLGPSYKNTSWFDNKSYYNFGCAHQRNLAAMVDEPSDLVQPRAESPAYTMRRNTAFEKYRKGVSTTTIYPEGDKAKLSDTGK
ncbi:CpaD family pilus assembly protein [Bradyrhizobium sp.]|uniref:CpaD family pilus assembly protein n=1 Tax=Bradyrhizobium sp. TaxID=376 RepID=UPI001E020277|nr:CpaD family pilus assembly protein [Bradyrhizobium sp.]MBI5321483.1 CpaD family pilus assembly protein [Bradyrhizobium sp.]